VLLEQINPDGSIHPDGRMGCPFFGLQTLIELRFGLLVFPIYLLVTIRIFDNKYKFMLRTKNRLYQHEGNETGTYTTFSLLSYKKNKFSGVTEKVKQQETYRATIVFLEKCSI
jgi:hypothetical protein